MSDRNDIGADESDKTIFAATLTPYRSLSPHGFLVLMAVVIGISFSAGFFFWLIGAWPIVGFFGLDVALVYLAFKLSYRSARAYEEVEMTRRRLDIRRVSEKGEERTFTFDPYWTRLEVDRNPEWGVLGLRIFSQGRRLDIGKFLNPDDRASFARAFGKALAEVRTVPAQESGG